jgi:hypothetical protein
MMTVMKNPADALSCRCRRSFLASTSFGRWEPASIEILGIVHILENKLPAAG